MSNITEKLTEAQKYHKLHPEANLFDIMTVTNTNNQAVIKSELGTDITSGECIVCGEWCRTLLSEVCSGWSCRKMLRDKNYG